MFNTMIGEFCATHNSNWKELLTAEPYYLKIKEDGDYVLFMYDQLKSDFTYDIVKEARGIIFKKDCWDRPVCHAFDKFFNYGESHAATIDWSSAFVTEKIDGSLIKVWWDWDGGWHVSTNGTIDAFKAQLQDIKVSDFGTYFCDTLKKQCGWFDEAVNDFDTNLTYIFELVGPHNRVVIPYDEPAIYFLGARNNFTNEEFLCTSDLVPTGILRPRVYPLTSLEDCIKLADTYSWDQEGFVVTDSKFNRVKIKSPAYVIAHFARTNNVITRKRLIQVILDNEVEEFLCYASDYKKQLDKCISLMNTFIELGNNFATIGRKAAATMSRKDYASMVKLLNLSIFHKLMFNNYASSCTAEEYTADWTADKWERCLDELERSIN